MRAADAEPAERQRRNNPAGEENPVPTDDNPSSPPNGGGNGGNGSGSGSGGGRGNGGGGGRGDGRGGGHHGGDDGDRDRHHRGRKHDDDHDRRRHRRHHDDNANIYDNNQNTSSNGTARNVNECDRGYNDGLFTGENDARRGQSYDPQRSHFYKRGGGGIFSIGRSGTAKQEYRECFLKGYEEGFRNYK